MTDQPDQGPYPDQSTGVLYQAATVAVLAAVAASVVTALAGGQFAAMATLDAAVGKVTSRLLRDAPPKLRGAVNAAAVRGTRRAHADLPGLGVRQPADPHVRDRVVAQATARLERTATTVAFGLKQSAQRTLQRTLDAAGPGQDEQARLDAAQQTLATIADRGGVEVWDEAGKRWNVDTYMQLAVSTTATDVELEVHHAWLTRNGVQLVYCSTSANACPRCLPWEGQILSIDGSGTPGGTVTVPGMDGVRSPVPVAGSVAAARGSGLGHRHCRHFLSPYMPGLTIDLRARGSEQASAEEARQAVIARHIRHWSRRRAVAITAAQRALTRRKVEFWRRQALLRPDPALIFAA